MSLNPRMAQWSGKRVWLVGASSGIGRATASALHAQGAAVIVSALPLDVTDKAAVRAAAAVVQQEGGMDCVVFCAGHYAAQRADALDLDDLLRHVEVNYLGALHLLDAVLPHLLAQPAERRGHISLVGSVAGYRGLPNGLAYGPTKAALINLAETLYTDLRAHGVGVSIINPGFVETPLTTPAVAAQEILRGWARGAFEIHFPRRFTWGMKLLELLPYPVFFATMRRLQTT